MKCDICGEPTSNKNRICERCTKIVDKVIKEVRSDVLKNIDDCKYIYPMIKRALGQYYSVDKPNAIQSSFESSTTRI